MAVALTLVRPTQAQYCRQESADLRRQVLPLAAQAAISNVVGRDQELFRSEAEADGFRMANRALSVELRSTGIVFSASGASWGLSLSGYGYGDDLRAATLAAPRSEKNRVEYFRGPLTEWYVNGPRGFEQGFTITRGLGKSKGRPLTIAFTLSGSLSASLDRGATDVKLSQKGEEVLRYGELTAVDAGGRRLRAWLELDREELAIRVDDSRAQYPVTIDPFVEVAKLAACDGRSFDDLGWSGALSSDGKTLVSGAPYAASNLNCLTDDCPILQGVAYVFLRPAPSFPPVGWPSAAAKLIASNAAQGDHFGFFASASNDGSVVAVSAIYASAATSNQGVVYVFVRPSTGWNTARATPLNETARLTASDGRAQDTLGVSVAVSDDGNTIVAGAPNATVGSDIGQGAVYVFVKPASGWVTSTETAKITASDGGSLEGFGDSVSISSDGSAVAASAPFSNNAAGVVYVFARGASGWAGTSTEAAKLTASDGIANDRLGIALAMSGDGSVLAAGADATVGSNSEQGAVYVFAQPKTGWTSSTETAKLVASDGALQDGLGWGLGISSDASTIAASAPYANIGSNVSQGAVYVFAEPGGSWATGHETLKFTPSDGVGMLGFGYSVGIDGAADTIVAGAPGSNGDEGALYVFTGSAAGCDCATDVTSSVAVTRGPIVLNPITRRYAQTVTVTNNSGSTITGPISLVLDSLSSNATLYNATGATDSIEPPAGSPYINSAGNLAPGQMATFSLQFSNPTNTTISYTTRVLAGTGSR